MIYYLQTILQIRYHNSMSSHYLVTSQRPIWSNRYNN